MKKISRISRWYDVLGRALEFKPEEHGFPKSFFYDNADTVDERLNPRSFSGSSKEVFDLICDGVYLNKNKEYHFMHNSKKYKKISFGIFLAILILPVSYSMLVNEVASARNESKRQEYIQHQKQVQAEAERGGK